MPGNGCLSLYTGPHHRSFQRFVYLGRGHHTKIRLLRIFCKTERGKIWDLRQNSQNRLSGFFRYYSTNFWCRQQKNPWFIPAFVQHRLDSLKESLTGEKETLEQLLELETQSGAPQVLSIVAAGNIPLVCWHDLVCCLAYAASCPNKTTVEIKLSSKDDVLLPVIVERLAAQEGPCLEGISVQFVDRVSLQTQAILFTGGAQAQEHYCRTFPGIPLLLRTGRSSVALVTSRVCGSATRPGRRLFSVFWVGMPQCVAAPCSFGV